MKCFQNILGKGVIAFSRQFLVSPQYCQIMCRCYGMNVSIRAAEDYSVKIYLYFSNTAFLFK